MKRHGNLWPTLTSFEHLLKSSEKAKRGKRFRSAVARYEFNLERELFALQAALRQKTNWKNGTWKNGTGVISLNDPRLVHGHGGGLAPRSGYVFGFDHDRICGTHFAFPLGACSMARQRRVQLLPADVMSHFWPNCDCRDLRPICGRWPNC